jgi:hypothetical protein
MKIDPTDARARQRQRIQQRKREHRRGRLRERIQRRLASGQDRDEVAPLVIAGAGVLLVLVIIGAVLAIAG